MKINDESLLKYHKAYPEINWTVVQNDLYHFGYAYGGGLVETITKAKAKKLARDVSLDMGVSGASVIAPAYLLLDTFTYRTKYQDGKDIAQYHISLKLDTTPGY